MSKINRNNSPKSELNKLQSANEPERGAQLVRSANVSIIELNRDGEILSWNVGATRLYGYSTERVVGKPFSMLLPEGPPPPELVCLTHPDAPLGNAPVGQFNHKSARLNNEGKQFTVWSAVSPIYDSSGTTAGWSVIEHEASVAEASNPELSRVQSATEQAELLADAAYRSRADFLANVSHELRTPMNSIIGMLQLALEEELEPAVLDYLKTAKAAADHLLELVNEILDFSKIESGNFRLNEGRFRLREVLDTTIKSISPQAFANGLELLCEIHPDVPDEVFGDAHRLQQVLSNLLSNAVKFTERGEVTLRVRMKRAVSDIAHLEFSVSDTGVGIAKKDRRRIFSPFAQADTSPTRQYGGTGLGLTICHELLSMMGSKLKLQSEVNQGSCFYFTVGLRFVAGSEPDTQLPAELFKERPVLIVDDNPKSSQILEMYLDAANIPTVTASSGEEALRMLAPGKGDRQRDGQEKQVDKQREVSTRSEGAGGEKTELPASGLSQFSLALIDGHMPSINGFELAERLHREKSSSWQPPPTILMLAPSDLSKSSDPVQAAPVDNQMLKPIAQADLIDTIAGTLDLSVGSPQPSRSKLIGSKSFQRPLHVLLVEDMHANRKVAESILKKRGHHVTSATDGREALDILREHGKEFDLVLMDVQMPEMDGWQATEAIRNSDDPAYCNVPIIAMTAHAMHGDREACLAAGMDSYLAKPIDATELVEMTERLAEGDRELQRPDAGQKADPSSSSTDDPSSSPTGSGSDNGQPEAMSNADRDSLVDLPGTMERLGGDEALLRDFVDIFLQDSPELLDNIDAAIEQNDAEQLAKSAHAIKGLLSNFGAESCVQVALQLEQAGKERQLTDTSDLAQTLREQHASLRRELEELRESC